MKKVKWGIIGCGNIAHTFAKSISHCPEAQLIGAASTRVERATDFAHQYGIKSFNSYQHMMQSSELDAIYIANTHEQHFATVASCLLHNKHVLCEKPITLNSKQLAKLSQLSAQQQCFLMEGVWMRFLPAIEKLEQLLSDNTLGQIHSVQANFSLAGKFSPEHRLMNRQTAGGALLDLGIYPISLADLVFNKAAKSVQSLVHKSPTGVDERNLAIIDYGDGQFAQVSSALQQQGPTEATIYAERGFIRLSDFVGAQTLAVHLAGKATQYFTYKFHQDENFRFEISHACQCILNHRTQSTILPLSTSLRVMELMDTLRQQWQLHYSKDIESTALHD